MRFPCHLFALALLVSTLSFSTLSTVYGQELEEDEIETDRDAFTRSPRIVGIGRTVMEGSYTYLDQDSEYDGNLYPDLLVRYGVNNWLELRGGWNYEVGRNNQLAHAGAEREEEGLGIYGAKFFLTQAEGLRPDSSLIVSGYSPTSGESNDTDFSLEYAFGWTLPNKMELESQIRWFSLAEEEDRYMEWAPSVVLKAPLMNGKAKAHVEYFSLQSAGRGDDYQQHYAGPGLHFLLTRNLEIGARCFWGMSDNSANFISNVGMAVRF